MSKDDLDHVYPVIRIKAGIKARTKVRFNTQSLVFAGAVFPSAGCDIDGDTPTASVRCFAKQAAEVVAVGETAGVGDIFHFHIVAF